MNIRVRNFLGAFGLCLATLTWGQGERVQNVGPTTPGGPRFQIDSVPGATKTRQLQASDDLVHWALVGTGAGPQLSQEIDANHRLQFFRVDEATPRVVGPVSGDWSNTLSVADSSFLRYNGGCSGSIWAKFTILPGNLPNVYFQRGFSRPFHYDFAANFVPDFAGMTPAAYQDISLYTTNQHAILGTVLVQRELKEFAVQLVGFDTYPRETISYLYGVVTNALRDTAGYTGFYFPVYEQGMSANDAAWLEGQGIPLGSYQRWCTKGNQCYSEGWAVGELVYSAAADIESNYIAGVIGPESILVTDGVPAEIPYVAGIISLSPATPNSHVAILAQSYGIPFAFLGESNDVDRVQAAYGQDVYVKFSSGSTCDMTFYVTAGIPTSLMDPVRAIKQPQPLVLDAKVRRGVYVVDVDTLGLADVASFGGKASNYGLLRNTIPSVVRPGVAFSIDLYDDYLDQIMANNLSLRANIEDALSPYQSYPVSDLVGLYAALDEIEDWFRDHTDFTPLQKSAIESGLSAFDASEKIRIRSSTNVEDSDAFSGAGLYSSYSGCLDDDTDADTTGPSLCDPTKLEERGVFRAMRRVYGSFYNANAYLERLRFGVDENLVGMGLLAHRSFPDDSELANGVAAFEANISTGSRIVNLVSQKGAVSVTNPEPGVLPEVRRITSFSSNGYGYSGSQSSSLLRLGENSVMEFQDYLLLLNRLDDVVTAYANQTGRSQFTLDFEYKKTTDEGIQIKQVRIVPSPALPANTPVVLVNNTACFEVNQGEDAGDLFALHRLKTDLVLGTQTTALNTTAPFSTFLDTINMSYVEPGSSSPINRTGPITSWPGFTTSQLDPGGADWQWWADESWTTANGSRELLVSIPARDLRQVNAGNLNGCPLTDISTMALELRGRYDTPQLEVSYTRANGFSLHTVTEEVVGITRCPLRPTRLLDSTQLSYPNGTVPFSDHGVLPQERSFTTNSVAFDIRFDWDAAYQDWHGSRTGFYYGYATFRLANWTSIDIDGLISSPLQLTSEWAMTYHPSHHNFDETFLIDPFRDPAVTAAQRAELTANDIRYILVGYRWSLLEIGRYVNHVQILSPSGVLRHL